MPNFLEIPFMMMRGGTSKGPCFLRKNIPQDVNERNAMLLALMGSPHPRQIDGIGGGHALASKVVIIGPSDVKGADIDYLMCQVHVNQAIVETNDCGNMLAAAACFAIEQKLVKTTTPKTIIRIHSACTGIMMQAVVQTPNGEITYDGNTVVPGVSGSGSPIKLSFLQAIGSTTGKLLPTGHATDDIDGITVSCVDVTKPVIFVLASAFGVTGYETKSVLDANQHLMTQLEQLRKKAAFLMGMGDVSGLTLPKICLVAPSKEGGTIAARYFIAPFTHDCHPAIAMTGALCLASACCIPGSVPNSIASLPKIPIGEEDFEQEVIIEHPSGSISAFTRILMKEGKVIDVPACSYIRTARPLMKGVVYAPKI